MTREKLIEAVQGEIDHMTKRRQKYPRIATDDAIRLLTKIRDAIAGLEPLSEAAVLALDPGDWGKR